ncbi:MAG: ABC transporter ATP-binding protein [Deltaproteobacteria bacterium]|nr:ABC transporter ATP-binding protein [Deltaproteobacteria bacterium]
MGRPIIEVENLTKVFGNIMAVDDVTFSIEEKEFLILLGPSGCGKTTILRMIAGLEIPTEGEIRLKGRVVFSSGKGIFVPARERDVGLVFQSYALWPHMTVFQNIAFGLKVKRETAAGIKKKVTDIISYMQLEGLKDRYPQEMSGGQQQRVALARMLVSRPDILLMDEPLSNLDAKLRLDMRAEIKNIHAQTGATTVYVTHDQVEAQTMASNIAVINKGIIEQTAPPKTIYNRPANLFVADFIGSPSINLIEGTADTGDDGRVSMTNALFTLKTTYRDIPPGTPLVAAIRPENISIVAQEGINTVQGDVRTILPSGPEAVLRVRHDTFVFSLLVTQEVNLSPGQSVHLYLPPDNILIFDKGTGKLLS